MHDDFKNHQSPGSGYGSQLRDALNRISSLVLDGLEHGFFDYTISCEIGNKGKRQLVIRAGKQPCP